MIHYMKFQSMSVFTNFITRTLILYNSALNFVKFLTKIEISLFFFKRKIIFYNLKLSQQQTKKFNNKPLTS